MCSNVFFKLIFDLQAIDEGGDYDDEEEEEEKIKKRKGRKRKKRGDDSDGEMSTSIKRRRGAAGQSGVDPKLKRQMRKLMNIVMKYTDR